MMALSRGGHMYKRVTAGLWSNLVDRSVSNETSRESFNARLGMLQPQSRFSRPEESLMLIVQSLGASADGTRIEHEPRM